jgi:pSer/pThr/pTyr-binding forkhead associated (FHA) protein
MPAVTFQVLEGIDKGRVFREMPTPVTIGREEGNALRLNDERVSRFHARVQFDNNEVILTDLDSTNGTKVNGNSVQIRRLRPGDRIHLGRSILLFGSEQEIRNRAETLSGLHLSNNGNRTQLAPSTVPLHTLAASLANEAEPDVNLSEPITAAGGDLFIGGRLLPPLPQKMSPSQAARLAELLEFLHRHLIAATENTQTNEETAQVTLSYLDWQRILGVQALLARYIRGVAEPDSLHE